MPVTEIPERTQARIAELETRQRKLERSIVEREGEIKELTALNTQARREIMDIGVTMRAIRDAIEDFMGRASLRDDVA